MSKSIKLIREQKEEYMDHIFDLIYEPIYKLYKSIYQGNLSSKEASHHGILKTFQKDLARIPEWNQLKVESSYKDFIKASKCNYFPELLKTVYILSVKLVLLGLPEENRNKIKIKVPDAETFYHRLLIHIARDIWKRPFLFYHQVKSVEQQNHLYQFELIIRRKIRSVIRDTLPIELMVQQMSSSDLLEQSESESESESEPASGSVSESERESKYESESEKESEEESESESESEVESEDNYAKIHSNDNLDNKEAIESIDDEDSESIDDKESIKDDEDSESIKDSEESIKNDDDSESIENNESIKNVKDDETKHLDEDLIEIQHVVKEALSETATSNFENNNNQKLIESRVESHSDSDSEIDTIIDSSIRSFSNQEEKDISSEITLDRNTHSKEIDLFEKYDITNDDTINDVRKDDIGKNNILVLEKPFNKTPLIIEPVTIYEESTEKTPKKKLIYIHELIKNKKKSLRPKNSFF